MSLGLRLLANFSKPVNRPESLVQKIEKWLRKKYSEMRPEIRHESGSSNHTLFFRLHPAAEEIELAFVAPAQLIASANTSTVGPGYHMFVTSLLKDLAKDFRAAWEEPDEDSKEFGDETGFFFSGNEQGLRTEMTNWLACLASTFFEGDFDSSIRAVALCMPMNPHFQSDEPAIGPLGPLTQDWLERTAKDGSSGVDFFAWWSSGFNAEYFLRRALAHMWTNVRWRRPMNDSERLVLEDVADSLRQAHDLNPRLEYPWTEWTEVLELLGRKGREMALVSSSAVQRATIGYRRNDVNASLPGGWGITIPGSFSDFESDGKNDLCAVDPPREIWFTAYRLADPIQSRVNEFEARKKESATEPHDYLIEREDYVSRASITKKRLKTGQEYSVLTSSNSAIYSRSVCTIVFLRDDEIDWAVRTWQSLQPPAVPIQSR